MQPVSLPSRLEKPANPREASLKERTKESGPQEQEGLQPDAETQAVASEFRKEEVPASLQSSHMRCGSPLQRGEKKGGGRWCQEREQAEEVRNPASSDLPTLLASQLCAVPHLTVIRGTPAGWMEAGHPEEWEMKRRLAADRRACEHLQREGH